MSTTNITHIILHITTSYQSVTTNTHRLEMYTFIQFKFER